MKAKQEFVDSKSTAESVPQVTATTTKDQGIVGSKTRHFIEVQIISCARLMSWDTKEPINEKDGTELFELVYMEAGEKKIQDQILPTLTPMKMKSRIPVEKGLRRLEVSVTAINGTGSSRPSLYYKVLALA